MGLSGAKTREEQDIDKALKRFDVETEEEAQAFLQLYHHPVNRWWMDFLRVKYDLDAARLNKIREADPMEQIAKTALSFAARRNALFELLDHMDVVKAKAESILETEGENR